MNITDLSPGDVAGFDLAAWKFPDGTYQLNGSKKILTEFPKEIRCNGRNYTFENIVECSKNESTGVIFVNVVYV